MEVSFRTNRLENNYRESAGAVRDWGFAVGRKYVSRINQLRRVRDFREAYAIRSFNLHPLRGNRAGTFAISLNARWRLIVSRGDSERSVIIEEVSDRYGD